jgi:nitroimidazol reductase NimA-like FMN-containing flavoprotein (pyridoxamine 5'-phosphate oxidase superfamily)
MDDRPCIIPTAYGREGDTIYFHGSSRSQMLMHLATGAEAAIAVTELDGIVLARSLFHSSMNYHSVVVYGKGEEITDPAKKMEGLRIVSESIWPGRWDEARLPDEGELKATMVICVHITDGAAKVRTGPPKDNVEDYMLDVWAGVVPMGLEIHAPIADDQLAPEISLSPSIRKRIRI